MPTNVIVRRAPTIPGHEEAIVVARPSDRPRIAISIGIVRPFFLFSNACRKVKMSAGRSFGKGRSRMQSYPSNDRGQYGDRMNAEGFP
jgi:hypothetical protein